MKFTKVMKRSSFSFLRLAAIFGAAFFSVPTLFAAAITDLRSLETATNDGALILALAADIRAADDAGRAAFETQLLEVVADPEATAEGRREALGLLPGMTSDASVKALPAFLGDADVAHAVRFVLEGIPGSGADRAFVEALETTDGDVRIGIIDALSIRRVARAVAPLKKLAVSEDLATASAAFRALGAIGDAAALKALVQSKAPESLSAVRAVSILAAADQVLASGRSTRAALSAVEPLSKAGQPAAIRHAALRFQIAAQPSKRADLIARLFASGEPELHQIAADSLVLLGNESARKAVVARAGSFSPEARALLLHGLSARGSKAPLDLARESVSAGAEDEQLAGLAALARIGDATDLPALLELVQQDGAIGEAALTAVASLPDPQVDALLAKEFEKADSPLRKRLPEVFSGRSYTAAIPFMLAAGPSAERNLATEIYKSVGALGDETVVPALLDQWSAAAAANRPPVERAIVAIGRRLDDGRVTSMTIERLDGGGDESRAAAIRMAGALGDDRAIEYLSPFALAEPPDEAALRAVQAWTTMAAFPVLEQLVARPSLPEATRLTIWQSMLRIVREDFRADRAAGRRALEKCLETVLRPEDYETLVEAVSRIGGQDITGLLRSWALLPKVSKQAQEALDRIEERRRESGRAI